MINKLKPVFSCFLFVFCIMSVLSGSNVKRASAEEIKLHVWVSETPMGDVPDRFFQSEWVYLCYELLDSSGNRIGNSYSNYQVTMYQYSPTNEMLNKYTYNNSNSNWISIRNDAVGRFTGKVYVTGSITVDSGVNWYQNDKTPKLSLSQSNLSLHTQNARTKTVTCTVGGDVFDYTYHLSVSNSNTSVVSTSWGEWYNGDEKCDLTITAKSAGSSTLKVTFVKSDGTVFDSKTIFVTVTEPIKNTYKISYNANGGINAPSSQTKTEGVNLQLSTDTPSKSYTLNYTTGYDAVVLSREKACTFNSWNTSSTGLGNLYMPGAFYTKDYAATLYAIWSNPKMELDDLPILTREGYSFLGWYTAPDGGTKLTVDTAITSNLSLYAHWNLKETPKPTVTPNPTVTPKPTATATPTNQPGSSGETATATPRPNPTITPIHRPGNIGGTTTARPNASVGQGTSSGMNSEEAEESVPQNIYAKSLTKTYGSRPFILAADADGDGILTYSSSSPKVAAISSLGVVTVKGYGKTVITIHAEAMDEYMAAEKKITLTVIPRTVNLKKAGSPARRQMQAVWKSDRSVTGYQVYISKKRDFSRETFQRIYGKSKKKFTLFGLRSRQTYFVKIRAYQKVGKAKYYGKWSKVKAVKVK